jgi:hypothetical protein
MSLPKRSDKTIDLDWAKVPCLRCEAPVTIQVWPGTTRLPKKLCYLCQRGDQR